MTTLEVFEKAKTALEESKEAIIEARSEMGSSFCFKLQRRIEDALDAIREEMELP